MLLLTAGITAFTFAIVLGEVLVAVFGISPRSLHAAATFGPGSEAFVAAMKVPFGPDPTPAKGSVIDDPVIARAAESLARELKWIWSPWRIFINNGMVTLVAWILLPWLGIAIASRLTLGKAEQRKKYLSVCMLWGPGLFLCVQLVRLGLWTATGFFIQGPPLVSLLPHGIPELTACFISALIPVHYYLRHVRGESPIRYAAYSLSHLGSYALVVSLLVLASFVEAGRLKSEFTG